MLGIRLGAASGKRRPLYLEHINAETPSSACANGSINRPFELITLFSNELRCTHCRRQGIETRRSGGKNPEEDWKDKQEIRELLSKRS